MTKPGPTPRQFRREAELWDEARAWAVEQSRRIVRRTGLDEAEWWLQRAAECSHRYIVCIKKAKALEEFWEERDRPRNPLPGPWNKEET